MAKKLNEISNLPQMGGTLTDWFYPITLVKLTIQMIDFEAVQVPTYVTFKGTVQPLTEQEIVLKPEEQRAWEWLQIHINTDNVLKVEDRIVYNGKTYKIMKRRDYKIYGYLEYHAIEDYQNAN